MPTNAMFRKTQDVLNYIYEYENQRPFFWIHAGSVPQFEANYRKLGSLAKIPGHNDTKQNIGLIVKQWLEGPQSGEWILVIDNADNMLDFYPEPKSTESKGSRNICIAHDGIAKCIPARGSKGTVIVTTRDREVAKYFANQNVIIKPELGPEQAIELFYQYYSNAESAPDNTPALPHLMLELQHLPLAIVQVAVYLDLNRSITVSKYLELFKGTKESQKHLLSKPHHNICRNQKKNAETVLTTFTISFLQLQQQSQLAGSFLRFMACIDRKAIPRDLLFEIKIDGVKDELRISETLDKLVNFSILQNSKIDFGSGQAYEIHSLVHLAMQTYLESGEMVHALANASAILVITLPDSEYENWVVWCVYLPHVTALLANSVEDSDSEASADLCMKAGYHLEKLGRYSESLILHERARKLYVVLLGEENTKTLKAMHYIGSSLRNCGRLKEAQGIQEQVLEVKKRTLGEEHLDTLTTMNGLVITYAQLGGRLKVVQELREKVLEVRRHTLGEEHPDTLHSMNNLAITYTELGGRLKEVQELEEKVLEVTRRTLGEEHPDTLTNMNNLALLYKELGGRLKQAQELEEKVLEGRRHILRADHGDTADAMYNLALTLYDLERLDEAISLMVEAACSYALIHGSDHSKTKGAQRIANEWKDEIEDDDRENSIYGEGAEDSDEAE
jgi:tetratricopeptide (TPR) repeat protein